MSYRMSLNLILPALLVFALMVAGTAAASTGSIVYLKNHNVWLADADGSNPHQVTRGGNYEHPWLSPSQSDDGTIAASYGQEIVRMKQNGEVLNRMNPKPILNSVSHAVDGVPLDVRISPNGKLIAYSFYSYECPVGASCGARTVTGYTAADRLTPPEQYGTTYFAGTSWAGNGRTIQSGGFGSQINFHNLDRQDPVHWFDDVDIYGWEDSTDLSDAELSPDGKFLAAIRGYSESSHAIWYSVNGNALSGPPPADPSPACKTGELEGLAGPTWSPDSQSLLWQEPDGIWLKSAPATCESPQPKLLIPGGSEPDWGPAANDPGPTGSGGLKVKAVNTKLGKVLKQGLRLKVTVPAAGKVKVKVRQGGKVVASGSASAAGAGTVTVKAGFTARARRSLARVKKVKLAVATTAGGASSKLVVFVRK